MKLFVYHVGGKDYPDTEAFGEAWRQAKANAAERGLPIYRTVIQTSREVYLNGGCFLAEHLADEKDIKIFGKEN